MDDSQDGDAAGDGAAGRGEATEEAPADEQGFATRGVHAGRRADQYGALVTPMYANATYEYRAPDEQGPYRYSRMAAPTRDDLETAIAQLHGATGASAFASGMAAIDAVFSTLSGGDHVVTGHRLYAETHDLLADFYPRWGVAVDRVAMTDPEAVAAATTADTALVYAETPANPTLSITDLAAVADVAHDAGAVLAVDNTFASPALQRPLAHGADLVVESLTKYCGGHSDAIAGAVATADPDLAEQIERTQYVRGAIPGPMESFLVSRGLRTLDPRIDRHCANARAVARLVEDHPAVERVHYPGLATHPGHEVAARQMDDFGGMVSFAVAGGRDAAAELVAALEVFTLAESLGGVESLAEHPASMTHQDLSATELEDAGIGPGLVRLSVGIEDERDLLADLERGLDRPA